MTLSIQLNERDRSPLTERKVKAINASPSNARERERTASNQGLLVMEGKRAGISTKQSARKLHDEWEKKYAHYRENELTMCR